jgi:hypothetical protein
MKTLGLSGIALAAFSLALPTYWGAQAAPTQSAEPSITLAQEGTGSGPRSGSGLPTGQSGTGKETDAGKGIVGKPSQFGTDQPTSGDFTPKEGSKSDHSSQRQQQPTTGGSDMPSGVGEKGTGQTQSSKGSGASSQKK